MMILDFIIILSGACFAQIFLREKLPSDKFENFILRFIGCSHETYEKAEYILLPLMGTFIVMLLINPQTIISQAGAGLTWSTTIAAVYNKFVNKNE